MLRPMIPLAFGIAILDEHTRFTCLETNTPSCHTAAIGTADVDLVHELLKWRIILHGPLTQKRIGACGGIIGVG
jgi:hypothetical protein